MARVLWALSELGAVLLDGLHDALEAFDLRRRLAAWREVIGDATNWSG